MSVLFFMTVLGGLYYGAIAYTEEPFRSEDLSYYLRMAQAVPGIDPLVNQPFNFRLLGPYLVGLLPVPEPLGFTLLTVPVSALAASLFYALLRYVGLSAAVSFVVVALALCNRYVFGVLLFNNFQLGDAMSLVQLMLLFLAMWGRRWLAFGVVLALGSLTREITILMVPVAFLYLLERREFALRWRQVALAVLPGVLIFVALRAFVPNGGGRSLFEAFVAFSYKLYTPESLFRGYINTFLPFTLVPLVYFRQTVAFFRANKYLLGYALLVYLSTTFGANEERLVAPVFIVFFMLLGFILEGVRAKRLTFAVLLVAGFLSSLHHAMGVLLLPGNDWTRALGLGLGLGVTLYMFFLKRSEGVKTTSSSALRRKRPASSRSGSPQVVRSFSRGRAAGRVRRTHRQANPPNPDSR